MGVTVPSHKAMRLTVPAGSEDGHLGRMGVVEISPQKQNGNLTNNYGNITGIMGIIGIWVCLNIGFFKVPKIIQNPMIVHNVLS